MTEFYSDAQRALQDAFDTRRLADAVHDNILRRAFTETDRRFIAARDFFFLSTVTRDGFPTVSYKGGFPGFAQIVGDDRLRFPFYDGNGMFFSAGNIADTAKIGMLFIDFERPKRLRVHGTAHLVPGAERAEDYPGALMLAEVAVETIFTNCPRYIHRHKRVETSPFVPKAGRAAPVPDWKRVGYLQDALPEADRERARAAGPRITEAEYRKAFWDQG